MRKATLPALAGLVLALTWATVAGARALPLGHARHLALFVAAGAAWALAIAAVRRAPGPFWLVAAVTVALRVPAWIAPPAHSDDVYRYLWDGRVQRAGLDPYRHAPDAPALAPLRDDDWAHINNKELPTIYPPLAELAFRLTPSLPAWKALVALADLGTFALLAWWLRRRGGDPRLALAWGWSPLAVVELSLNAHVDALGIVLVVAALATAELGRRGLAGALLGASAAVKLFGLALLPGLRRRRALVAGALVFAVAAVPYAGARGGSLGEYGRRWRGNDGAFALLYVAAARLVEHTRYRGRVELADAPGWARFVTGRDRDTVFPDEATNFLARALALALVVAAAAVALAAGAPPLAFAEVVLGGFVLLTPIMHPWYALWLVPLVAVGGSPAWVALAALVPLGYEPLARWLDGQPWHDPLWTRALEHGLAWLLLLPRLIPGKRPLLSDAR